MALKKAVILKRWIVTCNDDRGDVMTVEIAAETAGVAQLKAEDLDFNVISVEEKEE